MNIKFYRTENFRSKRRGERERWRFGIVQDICCCPCDITCRCKKATKNNGIELVTGYTIYLGKYSLSIYFKTPDDCTAPF